MTDPTPGLEQLAELVLDQAKTLQAFQRALNDVRETNDGLRRKLDRLEAASTEKPPVPGKARADAVDWMRLSGTELAELLGGLSTFVDTLVDQQQLQEVVLPCWFKHPAAVEELGALWQAREYAYTPTNDATWPLWWRGTLDSAQQRLRRVFVLCHDGHAENGPRTMPWKSDVDALEFERYVAGLVTSVDQSSPEDATSTQRSM